MSIHGLECWPHMVAPIDGIFYWSNMSLRRNTQSISCNRDDDYYSLCMPSFSLIEINRHENNEIFNSIDINIGSISP